MFDEAEMKIMEINRRKRNNKNICHSSTLDEALEVAKPSDGRNTNKDMMSAVLSHPICHPKDTSRRMSQKKDEKCKEKFDFIILITLENK